MTSVSFFFLLDAFLIGFYVQTPLNMYRQADGSNNYRHKGSFPYACPNLWQKLTGRHGLLLWGLVKPLNCWRGCLGSLAPLQGLQQCILTTVRMPVEGELLNKQTRLIKAETFVRIALKEREFSAGVGKADLQLVLCSTSVSYPFDAQGDVRMSSAGQPVAP